VFKYIIFIYPTIGKSQSITSDIFAIVLPLLLYMEKFLLSIEK